MDCYPEMDCFEAQEMPCEMPCQEAFEMPCEQECEMPCGEAMPCEETCQPCKPSKRQRMKFAMKQMFDSDSSSCSSASSVAGDCQPCAPEPVCAPAPLEGGPPPRPF